MLESYKSYEKSEIDWLGEIPNHWSVKRIKDLISFIDQGWSPNAENRTVEENEWGVLKISAVKNGIYNELEHKALSEDTVPITKYLVKENDILLTRSNTPDLVGDACIVSDTKLNLMYSDLVYKMTHIERICDPRFIVYYLISYKNRYQIKISARGLNESMVKVSSTSIKNWFICLPNDKDEQSAIADYLDKMTSKIDTKIRLLEEKVNKYIDIKLSLINKTVCRGINKKTALKNSEIEWIGDIPEHWKLERIKNIFTERSIRNINETGEPITTNILSVMKDVGVINHEEKGNVGNKMSEDITGYKLVYPDDIVVNKMNVLIGSVGISKEFGALSVVYIILTTKKNNSPQYYDYLFRSKRFQKYLRRIATGILEIREAVDMTLFMQEEIPNPCLDEQNEIVDYLNEKVTNIDRIIDTIKSEIDLLKEYRKTLINDVVTGKVRVFNE